MTRVILTISLFSLLLSACSGYRTKVLDTPETRGLKGWQKPYTVNGKRYDPLLTHEGFSQRGIASWYGSDFHGASTSNGEIYDMHALTAAHKTLPLGVYTRVKNESNGREVIVRINDRGPFVGNRVIDLSYEAARRLDMIDKGTAPVVVEALGYADGDPSVPDSFTPPASYDDGDFSVQIASFARLDNAERLAGRMRKIYGIATIEKATVSGNLYYRVRVGNFPSLTKAETAQKSFRDNGFPGCFIVAMD